MSGNGHGSSGNKQVVDDEGTVDQKLKNEIIEARSRVERREDQIFVQGPLDGVPYDIDGLTRIWSTTVSQYLRRIEPLLTSNEIDGARGFYTGDVIESLPIIDGSFIANREVYPRDGETRVVGDERHSAIDIEWSRFYMDDDHLSKLKMADEKFGKDFSPPEPKHFRVSGIKDVIEHPEQTFEWAVPLGNSINPVHNMVAVPRRVVRMNKDELKAAVRLADYFLQHHGGIAIDVGHQETDEQEMNPV